MEEGKREQRSRFRWGCCDDGYVAIWESFDVRIVAYGDAVLEVIIIRTAAKIISHFGV